MRNLLLTLPVMLIAGCQQGMYRCGTSNSTISVGQNIVASAAVTRQAGYELHGVTVPREAVHEFHVDPVQHPTPTGLYGFYVNLPGDRVILVCHDPQTGTVSRLQLVENWSGPAAHRVIFNLQAMELPRAPFPSQ